MSTSFINSPVVSSTGETLECTKVIAEFGNLAEPVALALGVNLFFETELSREVLVQSEVCDCLAGIILKQGYTKCSINREVDFIDVKYEGTNLGKVRICSRVDTPHIKMIFERLIVVAANKVTLESQEEAWLEELSLSWESLDTLYEISTDLRVLQNPKMVLQQIMNKAVSFQDGMKAIFWIKNGDHLEPIARKNTPRIPIRTNNDSLVFQAVTTGKTQLFNSRSLLAEYHQTDQELANAARVIIVPIATQHAVLGAIEIWSDELSGRELDSRTKRLVEALTYQGAIVLENDRLMRESIENAKLIKEVEIGSKIQQTLLLGQPPTDFPGLEIAALSIPSQQIDGDFYDFILHDHQLMDVLVGDVMGKGIPAALLGAGTKNKFLWASRHLLYVSARGRLPEPDEIVHLVHSNLTEQFMNFESFVTICFARFDPQQNRMSFVDCGHTKTVHYQRASNSYRFLEGENLPLGFLVEEVYQQVVTSYDNGDIFLFYSDGVTEAKNSQKEMFGEIRLAECVQEYRDLEPDLLLLKIREVVSQFTDSEKLADDFTCVAIKINQINKTDLGTALIEKTNGCSEAVSAMSLEIKSDLKELAKVRDFITCAASLLFGLAEDSTESDHLRLASNEAVTNVILHAYQGDDSQRIELKVNRLENQLRIRIIHQGLPFDPNLVREPSFDGSRDGGFGVYIISSIMDDVSYTGDEGGINFLTMTKNILRG